MSQKCYEGPSKNVFTESACKISLIRAQLRRTDERVNMAEISDSSYGVLRARHETPIRDLERHVIHSASSTGGRPHNLS